MTVAGHTNIIIIIIRAKVNNSRFKIGIRSKLRALASSRGLPVQIPPFLHPDHDPRFFSLHSWSPGLGFEMWSMLRSFMFQIPVGTYMYCTVRVPRRYNGFRDAYSHITKQEKKKKKKEGVAVLLHPSAERMPVQLLHSASHHDRSKLDG